MKLLISTLLILWSTAPLLAVLNWTENEIPMSDDMTLKGDVYLPEDWTNGPVILIQTPYNKNLYHFLGLPLGVGYAQETMGYAIVIVDWRGFYGSTDALYAGAPSRGVDGYNVVEWIASQPWCNGKVGTWGASALGRVQYLTAREQPPHLVCMVPLVASPTYTYLEYYTNGAARTEYLEQLDALGFGTSPAVYAHPYKDFAWNFAENANYYPSEIAIPTFMIGGWYDHNVETMLPDFEALLNFSPADVQDKHRLMMGPWAHGGSGNASVGSSTQGQLEYPEAEGWSQTKALQFLDYYLKDIDNGWNLTPLVTYFQMGDNEWLNATSWPVASTAPVKLYFHNDGVLRATLPTNVEDISLRYDPMEPSPTIGGPTLRNDLDQGPYDQSPLVEQSEDIVIMTTDVLNADVVMKGAAQVQVSLTTDVADTDVAIRLCDVYPDGRSMLVCDGIYRLRFMNGFTPSDVSSLSPGTTYTVTINMPNTALTFKAGHRIRLDITGSNYPRFNRNMNTGEEMYPDLNGDTLINPLVAHDMIKLSTTTLDGSFLVLPVEGDFPISINENADVYQLSLYPNPVGDFLTFNLANADFQTGTIRIFSQENKLVFEERMSKHSGMIDVTNLTPGMYEFRFQSETVSGMRHFIKTQDH